MIDLFSIILLSLAVNHQEGQFDSYIKKPLIAETQTTPEEIEIHRITFTDDVEQ